jgi:hypothetical protein
VATNDFDRELAAERFHARTGGRRSCRQFRVFCLRMTISCMKMPIWRNRRSHLPVHQQHFCACMMCAQILSENPRELRFVSIILRHLSTLSRRRGKSSYPNRRSQWNRSLFSSPSQQLPSSGGDGDHTHPSGRRT